MDEFEIGDTVQVTGPVMTGGVGTVTWFDEANGKYLVVVNHLTQYYFAPDELTSFDP